MTRGKKSWNWWRTHVRSRSLWSLCFNEILWKFGFPSLEVFLKFLEPEPQGGRENIRSEATVVSGPSQWLAHHPVVSICLEEKLASIYNYSDLCSQFGEGNGTPLQYSFLENPMDGGPGRLQSVGSLSRTRLSDFTFTFHFHALEKEMATYSSVLAWRIPGTGEPGGLPSMGSHRVTP